MAKLESTYERKCLCKVFLRKGGNSPFPVSDKQNFKEFSRNLKGIIFKNLQKCRNLKEKKSLSVFCLYMCDVLRMG